MNNSAKIHAPHSNYSVTKSTGANGEESFTFDGVTHVDFDSLDNLEDRLRQMLADGSCVRDLALEIAGETMRDCLAKVLVKLLIILKDSCDLKADVELLIICGGLNISDESDSAVARRLGLSRQVFSKRKKVMLAKLGLSEPAHAKSSRAVEEYRLTNVTK